MKQLFTNLNLNQVDEKSIQSALEHDLASSDVTVTFRWTAKRRILIYKVHVKQGTVSKDALKGKAINENTGTCTILLGSYTDKVALEVSFGILALTRIPKCVVLISQNNPDTAFQASPVPPANPHLIEAGEQLEKTINFIVK